jgi:hypothetical protein
MVKMNLYLQITLLSSETYCASAVITILISSMDKQLILQQVSDQDDNWSKAVVMIWGQRKKHEEYGQMTRKHLL